MTRTSEQMAVEDLTEVLLALPFGLDVQPGQVGHADLVVRGPLGEIAVEVKALKVVSPADARRSIDAAAARGVVHPSGRTRVWLHVLVADQITPAAADILTEAGWGWLDRRGRLSLLAPAAGVLVDKDVPAMVGHQDGSPDRPVLDTAVGLDTAAALLNTPGHKLTVREVAAITGRSVGAVHHALSRLRDEGIVGSDGRPLARELFWEISKRWRPQRVPLAGRPQPGDAGRTDMLLLGIEHITSTTGWALTDTIAANLYRAPVPVPGTYPPDFYVPDTRTVRVARQIYGDAESFESRQSTIAIAPISWVCEKRVDPIDVGAYHDWSEFGLAHPLFVALDLSVDARGVEILDAWTPPDPYHRVW